MDRGRIGKPADVAAMFGVKVARVYRWAQDGEIPHMRWGASLRFDLDALAEWKPPEQPLTRDGNVRRIRLSKGVDWELTDAQIAGLPTEGWVYFIQSTRGGPIKIGLTTDIKRRLAALQAASPFPLVVLAQMPGGRRLEYQLHRRFAAGRKHGEWFDEKTPGLHEFVREAVA